MAFVSDDLLKRLLALTNDTPAARWLVAYSGGIDSTVLLHALAKASHNIPILAIHIDHGLDPSSEAWAVHCKNFGSNLDIEVEVQKVSIPANPEDGYGWEKLFSEIITQYAEKDCDLNPRIARFHNCYGPFGTWKGGREKAPAAICRKVIEAKLSGKHEIEIWGDGKQKRSFMYIDDCITGIEKIWESNYTQPLNLGSDEQVSINQLVDITEEIADIKLTRKYDTSKPQGVRGRNSDNTLIKKVTGWAPSIPLEEGMQKTYDWIYEQMTS